MKRSKNEVKQNEREYMLSADEWDKVVFWFGIVCWAVFIYIFYYMGVDYV